MSAEPNNTSDLDAPEIPVGSSEELAALAPGSAPAERRFDFRHPVFLSSAEWRRIRVEVQEFTESLGALVSTYLRLEFGLQLAKVDTVNFNEFTAALPPATHLTLFKLEPLRGVSVVEVRPSIGLGIIDRLLGGPGKPATLDRQFTEMEVALMDQLIQLMLGEWCKQWKQFQELRPELIGHESNPRFLQSSTGEAVMLVLTLDARMGECVGPLQLAVPYNAFEPILSKLTANVAPPAPPPAPALKWNRHLDSIPIQLKAHWPAFKLTARELLKLKVGEVLSLQPQAVERVELCIGKLTKFRGRLGLREDRFAVQITEISKV